MTEPSKHLAAPLVLYVDDERPNRIVFEQSLKSEFRIKTVPLKQWEVGRELRRRIKKAFDAHGIRIPFRQLDVTLKQTPEDRRGSSGPPA